MKVMLDHAARFRLCGEILATHAMHKANNRSRWLQVSLPWIVSHAREALTEGLRSKRSLNRNVISNWMQLQSEQREKNESTGHLFNPLAILPISETTHSRLLGELLDPHGSHGHGRLLLEAFLDELEVPDPGAGHWTVSIEADRVDICLMRRDPLGVIIIENKSNLAPDQANQLYRYWLENIHKPYPRLDYSRDETKRSFQLIYLPPTAEKQPELQSLSRPAYLSGADLPATLSEVGVTVKVCPFCDLVAGWLERCEELVAPTNVRLRTYLQFYRELWN